MTIEGNSTVGRVAAEHPMATKVFHRHGIDYCCGGGKPLTEACAARGVDPDLVLKEIREELDNSAATEVRWDEAPLGDLIDHILARFHRPLEEELPRLQAMAEKVHRTHGDKDPENLSELVTVLDALALELMRHMAKEEQILFPLIREGQGAMAGGPVSVMESEHESAGKALERMRELTSGYEVPAEACNTWRALWHGLAALEESLHEHIHLENNILFPRALKN